MPKANTGPMPRAAQVAGGAQRMMRQIVPPQGMEGARAALGVSEPRRLSALPTRPPQWPPMPMPRGGQMTPQRPPMPPQGPQGVPMQGAMPNPAQGMPPQGVPQLPPQAMGMTPPGPPPAAAGADLMEVLTRQLGPQRAQELIARMGGGR